MCRERIRRQYDNPEALAWYEGALRELGIGRDQAVAAVETENLSADGSFWRVNVHAALREPVTIELPGTTIRYDAGMRLRLFHSNRFTFDAAQALLGRAGLVVLQGWRDESGEEGVFLCGPRNG